MAPRAKQFDESLYGPTVTTAAIGDAFAFVAILLRFLARRIDQQNLWYDDYLPIPSMVMSLAASFASWATFGNNRIPGNDPSLLKLETKTRFLKVFYIYQAIGPIAHASYKLSILALLLRVFRPQGLYRKLILSLIGVLSTWTIVFSLASLFQCRPVQKIWDPDVPGSCVNPTLLVSTIDISNVGLGVCVAGFVIYRVWRHSVLQQQRRRWIALFSLGTLAMGTGSSLAYFDIVQLMPFFSNKVYSLDGATMFYLLEINLGIMCACAPVLPPVFELCCVPRSRKGKRNSTDTDQSIKALELEANGLRIELSDPSETHEGRFTAELLDMKMDRGELYGTSPPSELPSYGMSGVEIDGREVPMARFKQKSLSLQKELPAIPSMLLVP